jgi:cytochrome c-type biogenesis protein
MRGHGRTDPRPRSCRRIRVVPLVLHAAGDPRLLRTAGGRVSGNIRALKRRDVFASAVLFVVGFSAVFAVLGVALNAALQGVATEGLAWLSRLAGTIVIILGLHLTSLLCIPILDRKYPAKPDMPKLGNFASLLFGASFAVSWTSCVGPILGNTLVLAAAQPATV